MAWELGHASRSHINVGSNHFEGSCDILFALVDHAVQHMIAFAVALKHTRMHVDRLSHADLRQIADVAFECERTSLVLLDVLLGQPDQLQHASHRHAKQMGVPHDVHVSHLVHVVAGIDAVWVIGSCERGRYRAEFWACIILVD